MRYLVSRKASSIREYRLDEVYKRATLVAVLLFFIGAGSILIEVML